MLHSNGRDGLINSLLGSDVDYTEYLFLSKSFCWLKLYINIHNTLLI